MNLLKPVHQTKATKSDYLLGKEYRVETFFDYADDLLKYHGVATAIKATLLAILVVIVALYPSSSVNAPAEAVSAQPEPIVVVTEVKPTSTIGLIAYYAEQHGADVNTSFWIAWCESGLENVPNSASEIHGKGIYQFVQSTWNENCDGDIWNVEDNIRCGTKLIAAGELWRWQPYSGHCWLPKL